MATSFHVTCYGAYGRRLPSDLEGYCHLRARDWADAPMAFHVTRDRARELAREARRAVRRAERALARWRNGN
jgi:hypothetical protein